MPIKKITGPALVARYVVLVNGVTGANGVAYYKGQTVTVAKLGGPERALKLLAKARPAIAPAEEL